jgi:hypothetical protein
MFNTPKINALFLTMGVFSLLVACGGGGGSSTADSVATAGGETVASDDCSTPATDLSGAFLFFGSNVDVAFSADGCSVTLEAVGQPDHVSPYWNPDNRSGLYIAPDDQALFDQQRSPGNIEEYTNQYFLTVPAKAEKSAGTTATSLGPVGIAISGAPIFNDQEGPAAELQLGVIQGFDRNGAHTGPQVYHYHLEPEIISNDDYNLIGIIADGFFIYGRKCYSTADYPVDLDASCGHTSFTQHTTDGEEYHYHIQNELYLSAYYLLFPGDYQGTANAISN